MNNADSFVRVLFHGLFIIAKNSGLRRWEAGLPPDADHKFTVLLRKVARDGVTTKEASYENPSVVNIRFDTAPGPERHGEGGSIDRANDTGDVEYYQWLLDLEHADFHNQKLFKKPSSNDYEGRITVRGGLLYTHDKTMERYQRFKKSDVQDRRVLGRMASVPGIEIKRAAQTNTVTIDIHYKDGRTYQVERQQQQGIRYELVCTNMPAHIALTPSSHFPHYYKVLDENQHGNGRQFNVIHVDEPSSPSDHGRHGTEDRDGKQATQGDPAQAGPRAVEPQVCNGVLLGRQTEGLPMS